MENFSLIEEIISKTARELSEKQNDALKKDLIPKLQHYGLEVDEDNFLEFVPRLTRVEVRSNVYEIYLDYKQGQPITEEKFLVTYSTEIKMDLKERSGKFIATIG